MKFIKRLFALLFLLTALPVPLIRAEGGIAVKPYWTFPTDAPVTHVQTGDINGDGTPEVVITTADGWLYVVENDGRLAWPYELGTVANDLVVADINGDKQAAEILVAGQNQNVLVSNTQRPVWASHFAESIVSSPLASTANLEGEGRQQILLANDYFLSTWDSETGKAVYHDFPIEQPVVDIWVGEVAGDSQLEIVPSLAGGNQVYVLNKDLQPIWQQSIDGQVGLVQGGDVDGDGQAEIAVLSASWDLFLLESDGQQVWRNQNLTGLTDLSGLVLPAPGQMIGSDLDGDGQSEIIVLTPGAAAVHVFKGGGSPLWQHPLGNAGAAARLTAADINGDGQTEVVVAMEQQAILLDATGHRLAEYHPAASGRGFGKITGALAYGDLNGDGQGEIIVGTETGLQVFGASTQVEQRELWRSPLLGAVTALDLAGLNSDGRREVVAGSEDGQVYVLTDDGHILWTVNVRTGESFLADSGTQVTILALAAGDVDGDDQTEVVASTYHKIYLLDSMGKRWVIPSEGKLIAEVAIHDLDGDGRAEIILGGDSLLGGASVVRVLNGAGQQFWQWELAEAVTAVDSDGDQILVGTDTGRVYRLTAAGTPVREYELGTRVLTFGAGQAITENGQVYRLDESGPTLVRELGVTPRLARLSTGATAILTGEGEVSLIGGDGSRWHGKLDNRAISLAAGDLNGDGEVEVAVGANNGRVHLFGLAANQPPLLTQSTLAETRGSYNYGVDVNDPDGDPVTVTVEIWDPSAAAWLNGATQSLSQNQGHLTLEVADPFDTWDSGQESRFRFRYDDGANQGVLKEVAGPFTIPTLPWYTFYGQWVGLGALIMLPVALGWVFYRRQRAYRRSPLGRAESMLKQLRARPDESLLRLRDLARDEPALLAYLPGLAREAGETSLADLSEGFQLILTRPEVAVEGLRVLVGKTGVQSEALPEAGGVGEWRGRGDGIQASIVNRQSEIQNLYALCLEALEANSVARIVSLQGLDRLSSLSSADGLSNRSNADGLSNLSSADELSNLSSADGLSNLSSADRLSSLSGADWKVCSTALLELSSVAQTLSNYQRVEAVTDKIAYLGQALETLGRLEREFRASLPQPEQNILTRIAANWLSVVNNALQDLQGRAELEVLLKTRQLLNLDQATLVLELTNIGRSPASNITVVLQPGQGYTPRSDGLAHLAILPAGRSSLIELLVSATAATDQFRAEFSVTFDDRERRGKTLAFADRVQLLKPAMAFQPILNPYAPGTPLRPGSALFCGREDLFQFVAENMGGLTRQNILVLIGQRRMGKTSFLQQLPARLGPDYLPVYLDGQSLGIDPGMANFFSDVALAISNALADYGLAVAEPGPELFQDRPSRVFERIFLPEVFAAIGPRRLLLLFDEFEELEMRVTSGKLEATIFPFFRHLMQHADKLGFVFVGTHRLEELSAAYWSILFNIALYKRVTFLNKAAAKALIVEPVAPYGLLYDDLALDKMVRMTAGHPYFLQLLCHALINHANREQRNYLTIQDVNAVLGEMIELGEAHFAFLWEQAGPLEQLVLAALMRLAGQAPTVTAAEITALLVERGLTLELPKVSQALRQLAERDIVREIAGQPPRYEYKIELVRLWVERYKALSRVIEETMM
jgi:hypothetical protein